MKLQSFLLLILTSSLWPVEQGTLQFNLGGKTYSTSHAQAVVQKKKGKTRILVAVKDVTQRFMLMLSAEVENGAETKPLFLTTYDSNLSVSLRTSQGALAILPIQQLAKATPLEYTERVLVETGETEDDPNYSTGQSHDAHHHKREKHRRKKIRSEYRKIKPRWHTMTKEERLASGEGVIENGMFRDTFFSLQLTPTVSGGKVTGYSGTFAGSGRFSKSISGAEIRPVENGILNVKVENVP
ncbi:MAG: hypothetical protein U1F16_15985 [Turneriella sp.]